MIDPGLVSVTDSAGISSVPMQTVCDLLDAGYSGRHSLGVAAQAVEHADRALLLAVRSARAEGLTWAQIGDLLGVTRQAAHLRFAKKM